MRCLMVGILLLALPACCPDVDVIYLGDALLISEVPDSGTYMLEVVEHGQDEARWRCGMVDGLPTQEPDCVDVDVLSDGSWDVLVPPGHPDQDLLVYEGDTLVYQEQMLWTVETGEGCSSDLRSYSSALSLAGI